jgi:hypothetical protein
VSVRKACKDVSSANASQYIFEILLKYTLTPSSKLFERNTSRYVSVKIASTDLSVWNRFTESFERNTTKVLPASIDVFERIPIKDVLVSNC